MTAEFIHPDFAGPDDIPLLAGMLGELFSIESDFTPDPAKQAQGLRRILENPAAGRVFVMRVDGRAVGMASLLFTVSTAEGGTAGILEDMFIAKPWRGKGLGRRLVEHICRWAREQGCTRITLLADKENSGALEFYRSLGFAKSAMTVLRLPLR